MIWLANFVSVWRNPYFLIRECIVRLVDTHLANNSRNPSVSKARSKLRMAPGKRCLNLRANDITSPFGMLPDMSIQSIGAQGNSVKRFDDKIVITITFKVVLQPFLLVGDFGCGIANPAFDIILIPQPNDKRRVVHLNRA